VFPVPERLVFPDRAGTVDGPPLALFARRRGVPCGHETQPCRITRRAPPGVRIPPWGRRAVDLFCLIPRGVLSRQGRVAGWDVTARGDCGVPGGPGGMTGTALAAMDLPAAIFYRRRLREAKRARFGALDADGLIPHLAAITPNPHGSGSGLPAAAGGRLGKE